MHRTPLKMKSHNNLVVNSLPKGKQPVPPEKMLSYFQTFFHSYKKISTVVNKKLKQNQLVNSDNSYDIQKVFQH